MTLNLSIIRDVSFRMQDPLVVKAINEDPLNQNPDPLVPRGASWDDLSLSNGYPSLLLLFSILQKQGEIENGDPIIHGYVLKIKEAIETEGVVDLSLFSGVSGVCFALKEASFEGTRYQKMLDKLHEFLLEKVETVYLAPLNHNRKECLPASPRLYDPIQGISGVGRYALDNLSIPSFAELAETIAESLVKLSEPLLYKGQPVPGWFLSPNDRLNARHRAYFPKGTFNLGLAHGVTGILAYLSIASLMGIDVNGQHEAIHLLADWVQRKSVIHNSAILWPYHVSWEEELEAKPILVSEFKDAWCYGVPGIARTLFLAGKALKNRPLQDFAYTAFKQIFARSQKEWNLPGPTLCHGIAGLLAITQEMAKEKGCEDLTSDAHRLKETLLGFYQSEAPLGFKDWEICRKGQWCELSKSGFLEGTSGILLSLLERDSNWHLPLMIRG